LTLAVRILLGSYLTVVALVSTLFSLGRIGDAASILTVAATGAATIATGVRFHRPSRPAPWYFLAAALVALALARFAYDRVPGAGVASSSHVGAYSFYLLACALLIAAMSGFARSIPRRRDWTDPVDIAVLLLAAGLLAWLIVAEPWWRARTIEVAPLWARLSYFVLGLLVLAALIRVLFAKRLSGSLILLTTGVAGLLTLGIVFVIGRAGRPGVSETATALGSVLSYGAVSAAAVLPSMRRLTVPASREPNGQASGGSRSSPCRR
jgi:hypothetical protein